MNTDLTSPVGSTAEAEAEGTLKAVAGSNTTRSIKSTTPKMLTRPGLKPRNSEAVEVVLAASTEAVAATTRTGRKHAPYSIITIADTRKSWFST